MHLYLNCTVGFPIVKWNPGIQQYRMHKCIDNTFCLGKKHKWGKKKKTKYLAAKMEFHYDLSTVSHQNCKTSSIHQSKCKQYSFQRIQYNNLVWKVDLKFLPKASLPSLDLQTNALFPNAK